MVDLAAARQVMVDCQVRPSDVTRYALIEAMLWAPREVFVPRSHRDIAYAEAEVELAAGRAMMTPRTFAKMVEAADIGAEDLVLDLCPGSGYSTAVLARLAAAVVAIEPETALAKQAEAALAALEVDNAMVMEGDPAAGDPTHGPYDVIFINGAVEQAPQGLISQLKQGGRLVAVMQTGPAGRCERLTRTGDAVSSRYMFDASAPLLAGFEVEKQFTF